MLAMYSPIDLPSIDIPSIDQGSSPRQVSCLSSSTGFCFEWNRRIRLLFLVLRIWRCPVEGTRQIRRAYYLSSIFLSSEIERPDHFMCVFWPGTGVTSMCSASRGGSRTAPAGGAWIERARIIFPACLMPLMQTIWPQVWPSGGVCNPGGASVSQDRAVSEGQAETEKSGDDHSILTAPSALLG